MTPSRRRASGGYRSRRLVPEIRAHLKTFVGPAAEAWVFRRAEGRSVDAEQLHPIWDKARAAAGIPDLHLHDLRHTGNTLASEPGATLKELMDRVGHASTRAALIYLHAREQRGTEIAQGIDAMVSKATKKPRRKGTTGHARGTQLAGAKK